MAYRAAVVGGSGYTGAELLRLLAGHPEIEVALVTADSNAGATVGDLYPSLAAAYDGPDLRAGRRRPTSPASTSCSSACRTAQSQAIAADLVDTVGHVVDLGADFRLPVDRLRAVVRRGAHRARAARPVRVRLPELYRDEIAAAAPRRRARLLPDRRVARAGAAARGGPRRADRHRRRRGVGRVGRGPRA